MINVYTKTLKTELRTDWDERLLKINIQIGDQIEFVDSDGRVVFATLKSVYGVKETYFAVRWDDMDETLVEYNTDHILAFIRGGPYVLDFLERIRERLG